MTDHASSRSDQVRVVDDAATSVHLARVRDASTSPTDFIRHARQIGVHLALAAVADIPVREVEVTTPLGPAPAREPALPITAVPVLRAGLGLLSGLQEALPTCAVGMLGLERDDETLQPREYYRNIPPATGAWVLVLEPMLATGGSAAAAVAAVQDLDPARVTVLSVVATDTAVDRILDTDPDAHVVAAAIDPDLDDNGYIVPGLGDFGDRLFGTPH